MAVDTKQAAKVRVFKPTKEHGFTDIDRMEFVGDVGTYHFKNGRTNSTRLPLVWFKQASSWTEVTPVKPPSKYARHHKLTTIGRRLKRMGVPFRRLKQSDGIAIREPASSLNTFEARVNEQGVIDRIYLCLVVQDYEFNGRVPDYTYNPDDEQIEDWFTLLSCYFAQQ